MVRFWFAPFGQCLFMPPSVEVFVHHRHTNEDTHRHAYSVQSAKYQRTSKNLLDRMFECMCWCRCTVSVRNFNWTLLCGGVKESKKNTRHKQQQQQNRLFSARWRWRDHIKNDHVIKFQWVKTVLWVDFISKCKKKITAPNKPKIHFGSRINNTSSFYKKTIWYR